MDAAPARRAGRAAAGRARGGGARRGGARFREGIGVVGEAVAGGVVVAAADAEGGSVVVVGERKTRGRGDGYDLEEVGELGSERGVRVAAGGARGGDGFARLFEKLLDDLAYAGVVERRVVPRERHVVVDVAEGAVELLAVRAEDDRRGGRRARGGRRRRRPVPVRLILRPELQEVEHGASPRLAHERRHLPPELREGGVVLPRETRKLNLQRRVEGAATRRRRLRGGLEQPLLQASRRRRLGLGRVAIPRGGPAPTRRELRLYRSLQGVVPHAIILLPGDGHLLEVPSEPHRAAECAGVARARGGPAER